MSEPADHARMLLRKAANDLIAADAILPTGHALDAVCFHAQQAAEKSIKALLAVDDLCYPWTHDIARLLLLVAPNWPDVADLGPELEGLTIYATAARYADDQQPTRDEALAAVDLARRTHELCRRLVGESTTPEQPEEPHE